MSLDMLCTMNDFLNIDSRRSFYADREELRVAAQGPRQLFDKFFMRLKSLAVAAKIKSDSMDHQLVRSIIGGIRNKEMNKKLLSMRQEPSLEETLDLCSGDEYANRNETSPHQSYDRVYKVSSDHWDNSMLSQMKDFFCLLEYNYIKHFLIDFDQSNVYADRFLLAIVFTYFVRAGYRTSEYNPYNFFVALMLAHDVEEDLEDMKIEFFPWALGVEWRTQWQSQKHLVFKSRDQLFRRISYRALVSPRCCEAIMSECPDHWAWQRHRDLHHGGVDRDLVAKFYNNTDEYFMSKWSPRGPWYSRLQICKPCDELGANQKLANNRATKHSSFQKVLNLFRLSPT